MCSSFSQISLCCHHCHASRSFLSRAQIKVFSLIALLSSGLHHALMNTGFRGSTIGDFWRVRRSPFFVTKSPVMFGLELHQGISDLEWSASCLQPQGAVTTSGGFIGEASVITVSVVCSSPVDTSGRCMNDRHQHEIGCIGPLHSSNC